MLNMFLSEVTDILNLSSCSTVISIILMEHLVYTVTVAHATKRLNLLLTQIAIKRYICSVECSNNVVFVEFGEFNPETPVLAKSFNVNYILVILRLWSYRVFQNAEQTLQIISVRLHYTLPITLHRYTDLFLSIFKSSYLIQYKRWCDNPTLTIT